eukprot:SAG11_NODE_340_length_10476_cov_6.009155_4_plen_268_part_00
MACSLLDPFNSGAATPTGLTAPISDNSHRGPRKPPRKVESCSKTLSRILRRSNRRRHNSHLRCTTIIHLPRYPTQLASSTGCVHHLHLTRRAFDYCQHSEDQPIQHGAKFETRRPSGCTAGKCCDRHCYELYIDEVNDGTCCSPSFISNCGDRHSCDSKPSFQLGDNSTGWVLCNKANKVLVAGMCAKPAIRFYTTHPCYEGGYLSNSASGNDSPASCCAGRWFGLDHCNSPHNTSCFHSQSWRRESYVTVEAISVLEDEYGQQHAA